MSKFSVQRAQLTITVLIAGLWLIAGTIPTQAAGNLIDWSRIVVRLAPANNAPALFTKGHSQRDQFEQVLDKYGVVNVRQVFESSVRKAMHAKSLQNYRFQDYVVLQVPGNCDPNQLLSELQRSPDVESAEFDVLARIAYSPNDPYFDTHQYALANDGSQPPWNSGSADADIDMAEAWDITTGDSSTILAILDTGMDLLHPDLVGRLWINEAELIDDSDNDSNGLVDDRFGWNFDSDNAGVTDNNMHGTHVAGIAAATGDNGIGIAGLNWHCQIMVIKVLGADGSGSFTAVAEGITYAVDMGADVISMSLSSEATSEVESLAVAYAIENDVVVVAAMANDNNGVPDFPAAHDSVISVGATDANDIRAIPLCTSPGSDYGPHIDVCAPGNQVWSTLPAFVVGTTCFPAPDPGYGQLSGTSMATPHVAGLASLILALRPDYTADSVRRLIRLSAEDQVGLPSEDTPGFDIYYGWGRINARNALQALVFDYPPVINDLDTQYVTEGDTLSFVVSALDSNYSEAALSIVPQLNVSFVDHGNGTGTVTVTPDYFQAGLIEVSVFASDGMFADSQSVFVQIDQGCLCECQADPECDSILNVFDVVATVDVAFRNGPPITDEACYPHPAGRTDVNCDSITDVFDVVEIVDVAFRAAIPNFCDPCAP